LACVAAYYADSISWSQTICADCLLHILHDVFKHNVKLYDMVTHATSATMSVYIQDRSFCSRLTL